MRVEHSVQCKMALDQKNSCNAVGDCRSNEKRMYSFLGTVHYYMAGGG